MGILVLSDSSPLGQVYPPIPCPQVIPPGPEGYILTSDTSDPLGANWAPPPSPSPSRSSYTGTTASLPNLDTGNLEIAACKTYVLTSVHLNFPGRCRIYTDNYSRSLDAGRSVGTDPAPGSGLIAEVVTISENFAQKITPFVIGGNLDNPLSNTIYMSVTNESGAARPITVTLTLLSLEV